MSAYVSDRALTTARELLRLANDAGDLRDTVWAERPSAHRDVVADLDAVRTAMIRAAQRLLYEAAA